MTFSFSAMGSTDDVRGQLGALDLQYGGQLADDVRALVTEAVADIQPTGYSGQKPRFLVEASGHADQHSVSLTVSVRTLFVQVPKDPADDEATGQ